MTNDQIELQLSFFVRQERKITNEILLLINLAEDRQIPAARGYSETRKWLIGEYKYSDSAAYRRIKAAEAIRFSNGITEKLVEGKLTLSNLAKAESMIKAHERKSKQKISKDEHVKILSTLENKTQAQADKILYARFPDDPKRESLQRISENETRLNITLSDEALADLEFLKAHWSHGLKLNADVIARALRNERERVEKTRKTTKPDREITGPAAKKIAIQRAQGRCQYVDPQSGTVCGSTYQPQGDHIIPLALGGEDNLTNMRCLCRKHNLFVAEQMLGKKWANHWRSQ